MPDLISINPANGETVGSYPDLNSSEFASIISTVQEAYDPWRQLDISERCQFFRQMAEVLRARQNEFARLMALEMGKPLAQGKAEIEKSAMGCEYYAENGPEFLKEKHIETDATESYISFQPLGVVLAVMPWNFPFWQVFRFAAPAMIAGNVALLKHASNVQGCADAIEGLFLEAGYPQNIFRNYKFHVVDKFFI